MRALSWNHPDTAVSEIYTTWEGAGGVRVGMLIRTGVMGGVDGVFNNRNTFTAR